MAHTSDYKRIYTDASHGLSVEEVGKALGARSRDLGTLCTHRSINKWAKYKPFSNPAPGFADATAYNNARAAAYCGLQYIPYFKVTPGDDYLSTPLQTFYTMMSAVREIYLDYPNKVHLSKAANYDATKEPWGYSPVTGMCRLLDFDGYMHFAEQFLGDHPGLEKEIMAPADVPYFIFDIPSDLAGAIRSSDIKAVTRTGALETTGTMYVGMGFSISDVFMTGGTVATTANFDGGTYTYFQDENIRFDRSGDANVINSMFLANGAVTADPDEGVNTSATIFIPVIPSINAILMRFELPTCAAAFDRISPVTYVSSSKTLTIPLYLTPNGPFYYTLDNLTVTSNNQEWCVCELDPSKANALYAEEWRQGLHLITTIIGTSSTATVTLQLAEMLDGVSTPIEGRAATGIIRSGSIKTGTSFSTAQFSLDETIGYGVYEGVYDFYSSAQF